MRASPVSTAILGLALLAGRGAARAQEAGLLPDSAVTTSHTVTIQGVRVPYTATAGTLPIRENGRVTARVFYVAYVRTDVTDRSQRPLFVSFNGGPGSSSVWMHMGYTGPRRVTYDANGFALRPPGGLQDNASSILDIADIVYIDPVATGFSRMVEGEDPHRYHGVYQDIRSVGEFVRLWVTRNDRWDSPKFLIGESYGTTRAAGLAGYLQTEHRMYLNGVILVSMTNLDVDKGDDVANATQLPHYTATAWHHKRLPPELQARALRALLDEAERFAMGPYLSALVKGQDLSDAERREVAAAAARYTGLSPEYLVSANLRVTKGRYRKELLRDQRTTVGRLDSRYTGVDVDAAGEQYEFDPAMSDWNGGFTTAVNLYLRRELGYDPDLEYNIFGPVSSWQRDPPWDVGAALRRAMTENPYLKVLIQGGYYDGATDYFSAVYTIGHLQPGGELRDRFRFSWYESGHMMYLRDEDLARANDDLRAFVKWALEGGTARRAATQ
jgi:carboxypeptidase C (cathepsin A)